jgi:hypothetical protein
LAAIRHHPGRVALLVALAIGLALVWWSASPVLAALVTLGCGAAFWMLVFFPSAVTVRVRGPGYQYRDDTKRR